MPPRRPGAASIASTKPRCTARRPTARCSRTTFARRSTGSEMWVAYQPIVRAASEEISGFEALVRWNHPTRGPISPDKFIPLAEECGMIGKIGEFVLRTAVAEAARWPEQVRIAVNLSPIQFNDPHICRHGRGRARRLWLQARAARAGDHRRRVPGRQRRDRRHLRPAEIAGRPAGARRFRHRLFLARLFEEGAVRQDQDRPELRSRRGLDDQAQRRDHPRHRHPGREPRHGHDRRGRRDPRRPVPDPRAGRQPGPGLYLRQADAGRGSARDGQQQPGRGRGFPVHPRAAPAADAPRDRRDQRRDHRNPAAQYLGDGRAGRMRPVRQPGTCP